MEDGGVDSATNGDRKRKERCLDESTDGRGSKRGGGSGRGRDLEGRYVMKEFPGMGVYLGKIVRFDRGFYRVHYEDGDSEDLEFWEIRDILITGQADSESYQIGVRKQKLDDLLAAKKRKLQPEPVGSTDDSSVAVSGLSSDLESDCEDGDSSGSIGEFKPQESAPSSESLVPVLPLPLPPSSGDLGIPEEAVSHLFSVYSFFRSFSHLIFLSPFSLDSFVGSLNCTLQNSLLDSIHVSLMRALRRHLQTLSSDGNGLALRCLRRLDWNFLDTLTWPVFLVEYLLIMGYTKGEDWRAFYNQVLGGEYYNLSLIMKLRVLQILCDDVLDSAELRAEIDMRESAEMEVDADGTANARSESGPKRVHPRYTKTSACKDVATLEDYVESEQRSSMSSKTMVQEADATDVANDGNSDECRLCGMDGTLLCCDGCPSAYHSRCIGLSKAHVPNGLWFCPECSVNRMYPACSKIGMGLRGAEVFGIDPYERVYLGTCNYLVVLALSMNGEPVSRYYSLSDVPSVFKLLYTSESKSVYSEICKGILQYWHPSGELRLLDPQKRETSSGLINGGRDAGDIYFVNRTLIPSSAAAIATSTSNMSKNGEPCQESGSREAIETMASLNSVSLSNVLDMKKDVGSDDVDILMWPNTKTGLLEHYESKTIIASVPPVMPADSSELNIQKSGERSTIVDVGCKEDAGIGKLNEYANVESPHLGTSFKRHCYINQYMHGDVAASAAANLAILMSENRKAAEIIVSSNSGKVTAESVSLQLKAFSGAALHFQWPSAEKRLLDVPRERCGWCIGCKVPPSRKMRCLLNSAALNVLKGAARGLGIIRVMKNGEGTLSAIAAYILHMEESLQGLIIGSLSSGAYRSQWRRQLEIVSSCESLKCHLLELEESIHLLAFSAGWAKMVDDWPVEISSVQSGSAVFGLPQKRGSCMRRSKKQAAVSEDNMNPCPDWWRGSKTAKLIFQKGVIPSSIIKKAGRQGGFKKIPGISYAEEISKRSQQFAWRAAVEMSRNASQLALQVRYLDSHIRWSDIVHPEQISQEGKGSDVETVSAFRNAVICGKKVMERKASYALVFVNKSHLPLRLMKHVVETEPIESGKEKMWFYETHVPLYLIKEYENKAGNVPSALPRKPQRNLAKHHIRQLKACQKSDTFSYLMYKVGNPIKSACISCQMEVFLRQAVKCDLCQGLCHKDCVIPSTAAKGDMLSDFLCNKCYHREVSSSNESSKKQLEFICESTALNENCNKQLKATSESTLLNRNTQKHLKVKSSVECNNLAAEILQEDGNKKFARNHPQMQQTKSIPNLPKKNKNVVNSNYGLVWRKGKAKTHDDASSFRLQNILLRCSVNMDPLKGPICILCQQPYNSDLMYIRCHTCSNWYHADAVQLKESQIFDLVGFRCCKCRRKGSPVCPYLDPKSVSKKLFVRNNKKHGNAENNKCSMKPLPLGFNDTNCEVKDTISEPTENDMVEDEDASLLSSAEIVEPFSESNSAEILTGWVSDMPLYEYPQKLPVRRHIKQEEDSASSDVEPFFENNSVEVSPGWSTDMPLYHCPQKLPVRRHIKQEQVAASSDVDPTHNDAANNETASLPVAEWDVSGELVDFDGVQFNEMEFEPQTYFSFQELLASEDDQEWNLCDVDAPTESSYDWSNTMVTCADTDAGYQAIAPNSSLEGSGLVPCWKCQHSEPAPDLLCVKCKLQIHSHCSPWMEQPSWDPSEWECGGCRNWR